MIPGRFPGESFCDLQMPILFGNLEINLVVRTVFNQKYCARSIQGIVSNENIKGGLQTIIEEIYKFIEYTFPSFVDNKDAFNSVKSVREMELDVTLCSNTIL